MVLCVLWVAGMSASPSERFRDAWDGMRERADDLKQDLSGSAADRVDTELGIYLHKNVGTLFLFDPQVREYEDGIKRAARRGDKSEAVRLSLEMENYILFEMKHNRRYKKHLKRVTDKLEAQSERFDKMVSKMDGSTLVKWLNNRNKMSAEDLRERLEGV